jgi:hypothetical protein
VIICTKVLITILITGFWIKLAKIVCICKIRWSVKDGIDREALEGIFGFFRWLINLWFILLTLSTFYYCQNLLYTTILVHHVLLYVVVLHGSHARDGWNLIQGNPLSRLCLTTFCHMWTFHILYMRGKDLVHSKRSVSEVGHYPCNDKRKGVISIVNGNVCGRFHECWHERYIVLCDLLQVH